MKRVAAACGPAIALAVGVVGCRAILGITDLTVNVGQDAAVDATGFDAPPGDVAAVDAPTDAATDATDAPVDAGMDSADEADVVDANCDYEPPFDASSGRIGCLQGCIQGHPVASGDFYIGDGTQKDCVCSACPMECQAFCSSACNTAHLPSCDDCATHVLVDDGGACHKVEDTTCMSGCADLAICLGACPSQ